MPQKLGDVSNVGQFVPLHVNAATGAATRAPIQRPNVPPGPTSAAGVNTTATTVVAGGGVSATVTPAAMTNIAVGQTLQVYGGTGTAEEVRVDSITATTFTAVFQNAHSGTYTIMDRAKGHWLHSVIINAAGTGMTLTLYNGNPAFSWSGGAPLGAGVIAVITPAAGVTYIFDVDAEYDLWYAYTGTTPGDVTITYRPKPF